MDRQNETDQRKHHAAPNSASKPGGFMDQACPDPGRKGELQPDKSARGPQKMVTAQRDKRRMEVKGSSDVGGYHVAMRNIPLKDSAGSGQNPPVIGRVEPKG